MEALIGAVAVDSGWNWDVMSDVTNRLLEIQLDYPDRYLKKAIMRFSMPVRRDIRMGPGKQQNRRQEGGGV